MRQLWLHHRAKVGPRKKRKPLKDSYPVTGHEVVDNLVEACLEFGDGDLHWGLTSSDVVDYARISQVEASNAVVDRKLEQVWFQWEAWLKRNDMKTPGRTHLLLAAPSSFANSLGPSIALLGLSFLDRPKISFKPLRGPTGASPVATKLPLNPQVQSRCGQTTDGKGYFDSMAWLAGISRALYKLAQDVRLLDAFGEVWFNKGIGSSSLVHKVNPTLAERVCSLAMRQPSFVNEVWMATATSGLERTLTDSALLRNVLPESYHNIVKQLDDTESYLQTLKVDKAKIKSNLKDKRLKSVDKLSKLSKLIPRIDAYMELRKKHAVQR